MTPLVCALPKGGGGLPQGGSRAMKRCSESDEDNEDSSFHCFAFFVLFELEPRRKLPDSETGRIRCPSTASSTELSEFFWPHRVLERESPVSSFWPVICVPERTHRVSLRNSPSAAELSEFSLPKQYSQMVFRPFPADPERVSHQETEGRFCKRVVLANVPSFRFSFRGNMRTYPRSGFRSGRTSECTLVPVFVLGEHPPKPPFWKTTLLATPECHLRPLKAHLHESWRQSPRFATKNCWGMLSAGSCAVDPFNSFLWSCLARSCQVSLSLSPQEKLDMRYGQVIIPPKNLRPIQCWAAQSITRSQTYTNYAGQGTTQLRAAQKCHLWKKKAFTSTCGKIRQVPTESRCEPARGRRGHYDFAMRALCRREMKSEPPTKYRRSRIVILHHVAYKVPCSFTFTSANRFKT